MSENLEQLRARLAEVEAERDALRALIEEVPVGITTFTPSGTVIAHNRYAAESALFPRELLMGASIEQLAELTGLNPQVLRQTWQEIPEGLSEREPYILHGTSDNQQIVRIQTFRYRDQIFSISQDITEERLMLLRLQDSEERLRRFFEASIEGILFRQGAWITDANTTAARMLGIPVEEMRGKPILDFVAPSDRGKGMRLMAKSPPQPQYRILACRSDGTEFPVDVHVQQIGEDDANERVICFVDVSQQEEAKNRLRESNALFEALSRAAPVALIKLSASGGCIYVNDAWTGLTGQNAPEALGLGWWDAFPPSDRIVCKGLLAACQETRQPSAQEYRVRRPDGTERWVFGQFAPLFNDRGEITAVVGTLTDLTDRKNVEEERARTLKQKELLLQEIHHRVKNNLLLVSSLLLLQAQEFDDPVLQEAFSASQDRIKAMALLHSNLYATTAVDRISFGVYTTRLVRSLIASIGRPDVQVHVDVDLKDQDALNIRQALPCGLILNELLTNSFKHAFPPPRSGDIWLRVWRDQDRHHLSVTDNGIGQTPAQRTSLGSRLIEMLCTQLGGELTLDTPAGGGSRTQLHF